MLKIIIKLKILRIHRRKQAEIKEKGKKGKITKAPPLSNLPPVVGIDNLDGCTRDHNRIEQPLL
jgi:hypothetical protein